MEPYTYIFPLVTVELEVWSISTGPKKGSIEGAIFSVRMWWKCVPYIHHPSLYSINPSNSTFFGGPLLVQVGWPADVFLRIWTFRGGSPNCFRSVEMFTRSLDINRKISSKIGSTPVRMLEDFRCCWYPHPLHHLAAWKMPLDIPKNPPNTWWEAVWKPYRRPCHGDVWGVQIPPQQQVFGCLGMAPCFIPPQLPPKGLNEMIAGRSMLSWCPGV